MPLIVHSPSPWSWSFDPITLVALAVLLAGYFAAVGPYRGRLGLSEPPARRQVVAFVSGWALLALTVLSPLDTLGRSYLMLARTAQLFVIITMVAPLLMIGLGDELFTRLIPLDSLRATMSRQGFTLFAVIMFNGIILFWQIPRLVTAAATNSVAHNLQILFWLVAGMLDWWPLLTPLRREARLASVTQIVYLAVESVPLDAFGVFLLFAQSPLYQFYAHAPRLAVGLSALLDQQIAGALVAVPGNIIDFALMSVVFFGWIGHVEEAQLAREEAEHLEELRTLQEEPHTPA